MCIFKRHVVAFKTGNQSRNKNELKQSIKWHSNTQCFLNHHTHMTQPDGEQPYLTLCGHCEEWDMRCQTQKWRTAERCYQSNLDFHYTSAVPQPDCLRITPHCCSYPCKRSPDQLWNAVCIFNISTLSIFFFLSWSYFPIFWENKFCVSLALKEYSWKIGVICVCSKSCLPY